MNVKFYWLRERRANDKFTVATERAGRWSGLGGLSVWWTRAEVEERYEIGPEIPLPLPWPGD